MAHGFRIIASRQDFGRVLLLLRDPYRVQVLYFTGVLGTSLLLHVNMHT